MNKRAQCFILSAIIIATIIVDNIAQEFGLKNMINYYDGTSPGEETPGHQLWKCN